MLLLDQSIMVLFVGEGFGLLVARYG
jgi:hypothetical protein